ncbi:MAG TPA: biotin-dependent carboxyltransferase family protein [Azospirillaceae bacterium]|nr:biotin-dependent carboxyltransferase family protein [Azospirillaceae bacterium]
MTILHVEAPGPFTTLQDTGRHGWQRYGVPTAGAMDPIGLAIADTLVGNPPDCAALEMTLFGVTVTVEGGPVRIAVAGADFPLSIDGQRVESARSHRLEPGQSLRIGGARAGVYGYLAVAGGFALPPVLGSRSTHVRSGIGGHPLRAGDALPLNGMPHDVPGLALPAGFSRPEHPRVRVVPGPQDDHFTPAARATLLAFPYTVTTQADRMGVRLTGPMLEHAKGFNIVSDAIAPGSIQVPGTGQPIVLLADRQTTGGYPKIATVISADLSAFAQVRPGEHVYFEAVEVETAENAHRAMRAWLRGLPGRIVPIGHELDSEQLLSLNLISGVTDGRSAVLH